MQAEVAFSHFLAADVRTDSDSALQPAQSRTIVATFEQAKPKKRPFVITVAIGTDTFTLSTRNKEQPGRIHVAFRPDSPYWKEPAARAQQSKDPIPPALSLSR
jgi:hypothetical protein